ncbi:UDP-N-acetylmuramoyl-tripeptide--D-alanyl-D-alanine ligase [Nitrosococcus watsonii]|uniref:UDP-N-acetylmuramoyl-tripeptide--D-alanyl-D-alanine ligase n=1 Tax=Nitrosococcus watsoni (strain C-113) TaxID=105559 RepID=D8K8Y3_NITWC|nr:UDP-N-acetylmuramoyl-tripeptide--D-alanyl-D-alanine ligase [Nitrosococcus watsonii]ADJ27193.1 UDP-N-acetylmuramoylalanyl-D-glutamyl-2,6-diaminopimelate/D-alanyl-D-alanyl ligase [Nitrosococcus watsonii C-113]
MARGFTMGLAELASVVQGRLQGINIAASGVSTDTRSLAPGALFVVLRGLRFDGHAFITQAREKGASAALLEQRINDPLPQIEVADARIALGQLAACWRRRFARPIVAVTGSNGKTTVKEMIASILGWVEPILATRGNLNNDIGVPLTLLELDTSHSFAVIEMGANRPGEIEYLSRLTRPQVALITNAGPAHLDGFGDLKGVARAKGEIFQGMGSEGVAILNADDPHFSYWRDLAGGLPVMGFGLSRSAEVTARHIVASTKGSRFTLITPAGKVKIQLPLPGRHNVFNALAASAAAIALGVDRQHLSASLAALPSIPGRLQIRRGIGGMRLLDDTYNANPASLQAALELLAKFPGERALVLGDFAELGEEAAPLHQAMGKQARAAGVNRLYTLGRLGAFAAKAFGRGASHFLERQPLLAALQEELHPDITVLVKGSRCMYMEQIVAALSSGGESG